jgi:hypothetical protein
MQERTEDLQRLRDECAEKDRQAWCAYIKASNDAWEPYRNANKARQERDDEVKGEK